MKRLTLDGALLLSTPSTPSWAQSPAQHQAHHPDQKEAPAAKPPTPPATEPGMGGTPGSGMMGIGTRAIKAALTAVVSTVSDEQKKAADELLAPDMGMMAMMWGIQGGITGAGQTQPGMQ